MDNTHMKPKFDAKSYVEPMIKYFKQNKNKELTEDQIAIHLGLKANQMRCVMAIVRYDMPIIHLYDKVYTYTTDNLDLLKREYNRIDAIVKQRSIKKNIIRSYIKRIENGERIA